MKISIITIVYNNHLHIADCIRSVQAQSYHNIEHIVIDGGSTDGTQAVIEPFIAQLAYYESAKDRGLYDALNKGILKATGEVVGILHSDDLYYEPDTIERIVKTYHKTETDIVYAHGLYVERKDISKVRRIYPSKPFRLRYLKFGWVPLHTTIYVRRSLFEKYGLYDTHYSIASDYDMTLRWLTNKNVRSVYLNRFVVRMRLGGKSTTARLQKKKSLEDLDIIKHYHLYGPYTLGFKIVRKIPQYIIPRVLHNNALVMNVMMLKPRGVLFELQEKVRRVRARAGISW